MRDAYADLELLENYCQHAGYNRGVLLVMTDHEYFVNPKVKRGKCWDFDISHGTEVENATLGGKPNIAIHLGKSYEFNWVQRGSFWFMEIEGR
ncbi:MAG: hypothetical protein OXF20_00100 [Gammaproteobacteria bacterium]|nr:hypothetical protein [Gammaproteobacteria bacterium]